LYRQTRIPAIGVFFIICLVTMNRMFTGIVEKITTVAGVADGPGFRQITLAMQLENLQVGQSVAINGCCLTAARISPHEVGFDAIKETLDKTNLGFLTQGDAVNIERSLRIGDRLDGHFVQGHVDGRARLVKISSNAGEWRLTLEAPDHLAKYLAPKGSVTLDGVSLTLASAKNNIFEVALIPETLRVTTLGKKQVGWEFNLEADILTKTVVSWLERQNDHNSG
jgi:riboflavin synthase